jgi:hypothetical protein
VPGGGANGGEEGVLFLKKKNQKNVWNATSCGALAGEANAKKKRRPKAPFFVTSPGR